MKKKMRVPHMGLDVLLTDLALAIVIALILILLSGLKFHSKLIV